MRFPRLNRTTWTLAAVVALLAATGAAFLIAQGNKAAKNTAVVAPTTTATPPVTTTATTTTTAPPAPRRVDNFTVAFYGNRRTRTRDFKAIPSLHPPFKLAWAFGGNALLEFPATIWGNNLYLIDDGATVKRVNITTGKQIWLRHVGLLSASTPSLDVKRKELFVSILSTTCGTIGCADGEVAALSMLSGKILWQFPVSSGTESSPMIVGNSVYFGDQAGTFYSLNVRTGHENWSFSTGGSIKGGADYYDGNLYFGNYAGQFYAVNAKSGREVWGASPGGQFYSTPAVAFGRVYVGNKNGDAYAFDLRSGGASRGAPALGDYVYGGPAVADIKGLGPTVYIGSYDADLYALNAATGGVSWTADVGGAISGSATVVNNTVYVSIVYGKGSYGFNARTGQRVFYFPDGSYTTAVADRNALFLMGKYVMYKFVPHNAKLPKLQEEVATCPVRSSGKRGQKWPQTAIASVERGGIDPELIEQCGIARRCGQDRAAAAACEPLAPQQHLEHPGTERAAEVRPLLAPVDAIADQRAAALGFDRDAQFGQVLRTGVGEMKGVRTSRTEDRIGRVGAAALGDEVTALEQRVGERDTEPSGEMVVAAARRRSACARVACRSERTGLGGASRARLSSVSATSALASR